LGSAHGSGDDQDEPGRDEPGSEEHEAAEIEAAEATSDPEGKVGEED
jgi:hypothetical protein